jgi:hypothetical protein
MENPKPGVDLIQRAREVLGERWGVGRPLAAAELGRCIGMAGARTGETILNWSNPDDDRVITGPARTCLELMLLGAIPASAMEAFRSPDGSVAQPPIKLIDLFLAQTQRAEGIGARGRLARERGSHGFD